MDSITTDDRVTIMEVRRLLAERAAKKQELDALDNALENLVGLCGQDRPKKPRLSNADIRNACCSKK